MYATVPHSPPTDVTYSSVGTRTVTISWNPPVFEDQNGVILYYQLIFTQTQFEIENLTITISELSYAETNLEEYNGYSFTVAAATRVGLGPHSAPQMFMTLEAGMCIQVMLEVQWSFVPRPAGRSWAEASIHLFLVFS